MINDAHCHFFSAGFFSALARQLGREVPPTVDAICRELQWDAPGDPGTLAARWVAEQDSAGVSRAVLIASVPGDEQSVAAAVSAYPDRFVGYFMVDPSKDDAVERTERATRDMRLRGVCLFPAMHHVPLEDERTERVVGAAAAIPGTVVFVHCGVLSVGVRKKLGLSSPFDLSLGDPLAVARLANRHAGTTFVIPHFGAGRFDDALEAAGQSDNIVLDTSSSNSWIASQPGLTLEDVFRKSIAAIGAARLLFGTDSSFFPRGWQRSVYDAQRQALASAGVSGDDQSLIFGENFARLFA